MKTCLRQSGVDRWFPIIVPMQAPYTTTYYLWFLPPVSVRVFTFLLSGLFCCLGFSGVMFFAVWEVACFIFFAVWARARALPKQQKKNTHPPKQQKNKHAPAPSERVLFSCLGGWACSLLCCLDGGRVFFAVCAGGVFFVCCLGGGVFFFAVWAGGVLIFFAAWPGGVGFFLLFGRGTGVHSLTSLPGSSSSDPATKKTKQQKKKKKKHGSPPVHLKHQ